jgi:transcriptional regulator with XRE-family HTH domain
MDIPEDFAGRLRLALKQANISPAALGAAVGVDKSVVSRWISGRVRPTQHNLSRIAGVLAQGLPGFTVLAFEAPASAFRALLQPAAPDMAEGQNLPIPFGLLDASRRETGRRGMEYFGSYLMYYHAFSQPGRIARMALMLRPVDGLIEARYGAEGFAFHGWALLMLNRMYVVLAEERFEAMAFLVLNAGQQPKARFITGILTGPAEGLLVPTASPVVLVRQRELTGEAGTDIAAHEEDCGLPPLIDPATAPASVRRALGEGPLMQVPFATGEEQ